jgi:ribose-phosphate pyrophosphokinase
MSETVKRGTIHWYGTMPESRGAASAPASGVVEIGHYPSGEPVINFPNRGVQVKRLLLRPMSMLDLMGGLFFADALQERGQRLIELVLPFVPGARQDRMNSEGDYLFTAKSVAKDINARTFRKVTVLDPHSEVISGMINRCSIVHADECVRYGLGHGLVTASRYTAVVSPDSGAEKRAGAVARMLSLPMIHGWKTRDVSNGKITGFGLERADISGHVLVVDDICDGGGTFVGLASILKERNLKADLYVTHGIFSQGTARLLEHYEQVICTDSLEVVPSTGVVVLPVSQNLFEGTT